MSFEVLLTGKGWWGARRLLKSNRRFKKALEKVMLQEAHDLRKGIVKGITKQAPGGKKFDKHSRLTIAMRRYQGFRGRKKLIRTGDLRNSIAVKKVRDGVFVGVPRGAKSREGRDMVNIATIMENGAGPYVVRMTPKSRAFFFKFLRQSGVRRTSNSGSGRGYFIIKIPARPFLGPIIEEFYGDKNEAGKRVARRVKLALNKAIFGSF